MTVSPWARMQLSKTDPIEISSLYQDIVDSNQDSVDSEESSEEQS